MILKFLYDHIALGQDFQIRVKWAAKTVVVWDVRTLSDLELGTSDLTTETESRDGALGDTRLG